MTRILLFIFFLIISNQSMSYVQGIKLICDDDRRGYNFIDKDKVEVSIINPDDNNVVYFNYLYELSENAIFIKEPEKELNKVKIIGWIFRRNLDYVSLYYEGGDLSRKFLWSCEITSLEELESRLNNNFNK